MSRNEVDTLYKKLDEDAVSGGYYLNPDIDTTKDLVEGLLINQKRYGYLSCPCRLSEANREADIDIICPCDYRDADLDEYGTCYCSLYVSKDVVDGKKKIMPIPERRPVEGHKIMKKKKTNETSISALSYPVWRCKVCGYLCARDNPPGLCPICKAEKDRFEIFIGSKNG
ncbi:MAG: hypothetical protein JXB06_11150 [Spirochaetales bacterium]|nr:hypothetical protein [Spirochaetales bacterium]